MTFDLADFRFAWPVLLVLLALPWVFAAALRRRQSRQSHHVGGALRLPFARQLLALQSVAGALPPDAATHSGRTPWLLPAGLIYGLLVLAAARPQIAAQVDLRPVSGRDVLIVLDVSASMATQDLQSGIATGRAASMASPAPVLSVSRLAAAADLGARFLVRREGDRAGLIVFARRPYLYTPLSYDLPAVAQALDGVAVGLAGRETALGDALGLAVRVLTGESAPAESSPGAGPGSGPDAPLGQSTPATGKVVVLISDGANTAGALSPTQAAWLAAQRGVRVHALRVGGGLDEDAAVRTLRPLAEQTAGHFAVATDHRAVADFFARIDALEPARRPAGEAPPPVIWHELYGWLLAFALAGQLGLSVAERVAHWRTKARAR